MYGVGSPVEELQPFYPGNIPAANDSSNGFHCWKRNTSGGGTVSALPTVVSRVGQAWILFPWQSAADRLEGVAMQPPPHGDTSSSPMYRLASLQRCQRPCRQPGSADDDGSAALWQLGRDSARWSLSDGVAVSNSRNELWVWRERPMDGNQTSGNLTPK
jgi:hypothetical protein